MFRFSAKTKLMLFLIGLVIWGVLFHQIYQADHRPLNVRSAPQSPLTPVEIAISEPITPPRYYACHRAAHVVHISGRGSDIAWKEADWTDFFVDIEGEKKPQPRFHTRAKMLWDDQFLYVYAELEEPDLWATLKAKNSVIYHDNDFEVFIDPENSGENYYEFEMNALNTIWELTLPRRYSRGGSAILGTNLPGLISAVNLDGTLNDPADTDHGWSVEIAFPFSGLASHKRNGPCPPRTGDRWRINFSRVEWTTPVINGEYHKIPKEQRNEDNWVWSPQGVIDMHQPEHWGCLEFVK